MKWEQERGVDPEYLTKLQKGQLDRSIRRHGVDGDRSNHLRHLIAAQLERRQRFDEARLLREVVLESKRRTKGIDDVETLLAETRLAASLLKSGRFEEAHRLQLHAAERFEATLGPDDERTVAARRVLSKHFRNK